MNQQFLTELKAVTAENRIFTDEPMKKHTTFRVGGPADILVQPKGTELALGEPEHESTCAGGGRWFWYFCAAILSD